MFPVTEQISITEKTLNTEIDRNFYKIPKYDFENCKTVLKNGQIVYIEGYEAVRQWIEKFCRIFTNKVEVYKNTEFGTNANELFGKKYLNNGYEEAEYERQLKEGLILCPAIRQIENFNMTKKGNILDVEFWAVLYDNTNVKVELDDITI